GGLSSRDIEQTVNMKYLLLLMMLMQTMDVPDVKSTIDKSSDYYETSIDGYKKNEFWGNWSVPLSDSVLASSTKAPEGNLSYSIKNIQDNNLNTAWVFESNEISNDCYFEFDFKFPVNASYAGAYQFQGICNVFNGYCKSLKTWAENARVKRLLVYYNDKPICYVNLLDTWHFQEFDISKFFRNNRDKKNLNAKYEIRNGDKLKFKVIEIYKGTKFNDVAISEFLCEGGTN
ncbi:MAG TPA: hypothetical protein VGG71_00425, partial [Chitinophagaceae bacterium]